MVKLTDVAGIGPVTIKILSEHKIRTVEALAAISLAELQKIPGFSGAVRAQAVKKSAADCLQAKPVKPLAAASATARAKAKEAPGKITVIDQITSQPEPGKTDDESKKNKRSDDGKQKLKDKKDKNKDKKKDGKKKGKNKKKS
ncbi:MAG: helix-hairpin-helix domain-containing protein [Nitrosomonas ureae]